MLQLFPITPDKFKSAYLSGALPQFDAMATFSSIEHSGLGRYRQSFSYLINKSRSLRSLALENCYLCFNYRYGDGLHPWGDLVAMARVHCVLKEGGQVMVGVPIGWHDTIVFNAHRLGVIQVLI